MTSSTPRHEHIGLVFSPPALYPPLEVGSSELSHVDTILPIPDGSRIHVLPGSFAVRGTGRDGLEDSRTITLFGAPAS